MTGPGAAAGVVVGVSGGCVGWATGGTGVVVVGVGGAGTGLTVGVGPVAGGVAGFVVSAGLFLKNKY